MRDLRCPRPDATAHEIDELRSICEDWAAIATAVSKRGKPTPKQHDRWLDNEERFHDLVITASRNRWLVNIMSDLRLVGQCFRPQRSKPDILTPDTASETVASHTALVDALEARDAARAEKLTYEQLQFGRERVLSYFDQQRDQ